jgi:hypothetical protein
MARSIACWASKYSFAIPAVVAGVLGDGGEEIVDGLE